MSISQFQPTMVTTLKQAGVADAVLLLEYMEEFYRYEHLDFHAQKTPAALHRLLADGTLGRVWLIQREDVSVGYIVLVLGYSLEYYGRDAFIDEFYIREEYRRQGIGRAVMALVEEQAKSMGVQALHLEVDHKNLKAQELYRRQGYVDHDRYLMTKRIQLIQV